MRLRWTATPLRSGELNHALSWWVARPNSQLTRPMSSGHHISTEHRLRRKHQKLNSETNASNEIHLDEKKQRRKTEETHFFKKQEKENMKNENQESGVTLKWEVPSFGQFLFWPILVANFRPTHHPPTDLPTTPHHATPHHTLHHTSLQREREGARRVGAREGVGAREVAVLRNSTVISDGHVVKQRESDSVTEAKEVLC